MEIYLGKTVIYEPAGGMQYRGMKLVAVITRVYENERVNLAIFDPTGNIMQNPPTNIPYEQLSEAAPEVHADDCLCGRCVSNRSIVRRRSPNSAEQFNTQISGVPDPYHQSMPNSAEPQMGVFPTFLLINQSYRLERRWSSIDLRLQRKLKLRKQG